MKDDEMTDEVDPIFVKAHVESIGSMLLDIQQECIALRQIIARLGEQFRFYERAHRAKTEPGGQFDQPGKGRDDTLEKAEVNRHMAELCELAISSGDVTLLRAQLEKLK